MAFEIVKTFVVKASAQAVWDFLIDPQRMVKCLPGAAITQKVDDKTWLGTITVKVGPVSSSYKGKIVFDKLDAAARAAEIVGSGQDVRGRGGADLKMKSSVKELGPSESEVTAASTVNITGILAQMGRGMIQDVSDQMFQVFSQRVRAELENAPSATAPSAAPAAAAPAAGSAAAPTPVIEAPLTASPMPAALAPTPVAPAPSAAPAVLDLGAIGTKVVVRRALRSPLFWVVAAAAVWLVSRMFR
jgi:carbon monoxide dehydrogenase subunit G